MHAFGKPFFEAPRILIKPFCARDAAMVETKAMCKFTDKICMRSFCVQLFHNLKPQI